MWQIRATELLWKIFEGCVVCDPTRWDDAETHEKDPQTRQRIVAHRAHAIGEKNVARYPAQAPWEEEHMNLASKQGRLLFWMERESKKYHRPKSEGVYAQDTRVEAGIWIQKLKADPALRISFGGHWDIDSHGQETKKSFGGMNFIVYYLTGVKDRRRLYNGEVAHPNLVRAESVENFIAEATKETGRA